MIIDAIEKALRQRLPDNIKIHQLLPSQPKTRKLARPTEENKTNQIELYHVDHSPLPPNSLLNRFDNNRSVFISLRDDIVVFNGHLPDGTGYPRKFVKIQLSDPTLFDQLFDLVTKSFTQMLHEQQLRTVRDSTKDQTNIT